MLKNEVEARGLGSMIARTGDALLARIKEQEIHGTTLSNFEPLIHTHNGIVGSVIHCSGGHFVNHDAEQGGALCPVCYTLGKLQGPNGGYATAKDIFTSSVGFTLDFLEALKLKQYAQSN